MHFEPSLNSLIYCICLKLPKQHLLLFPYRNPMIVFPRKFTHLSHRPPSSVLRPWGGAGGWITLFRATMAAEYSCRPCLILASDVARCSIYRVSGWNAKCGGRGMLCSGPRSGGWVLRQFPVINKCEARPFIYHVTAAPWINHSGWIKCWGWVFSFTFSTQIKERGKKISIL